MGPSFGIPITCRFIDTTVFVVSNDDVAKSIYGPVGRSSSTENLKIGSGDDQTIIGGVDLEVG